MNTINFENVTKASDAFVKKIKRASAGNPSKFSVNTILLRNKRPSCICYFGGCPEKLSGDQCGILTQDCFIGSNSSGQRNVFKILDFYGRALCNDVLITINYDFGFSADEVTISSILTDGNIVSVGKTGCINGVGTITFIIPKKTTKIQAETFFSCAIDPPVNSSIDKFEFECSVLP